MWDGVAVPPRRLSESSVVMACKAVIGAMAQLRAETGPESGKRALGKSTQVNTFVGRSSSHHYAHRSLSPFVPKDKARQGKGLLHNGSGLRLN